MNSKSKGLYILLTLLVTLFYSYTLKSQTKEKIYQQIVQKHIQAIFDEGIGVGASIGIVKDGKQYLYFYGEKEKGKGEKPDINTIYEIGSITKTFTGTILAQFVQENKLHLETPASSILPEVKQFPSYQDQVIQLIHLATHTSSLPRLADDLFSTKGFNMQNPYEHYSPELLYAFLGRYQLPRAIGSQYEYSNLAAGLLGHLLGKAAKSNIDDLYQTKIFGPLKMTNSFTHSTKIGSNFAVPHNGGTVVSMWDFQDNNVGAGGIKSSLGDMLNYLVANMEAKAGENTLQSALKLAHAAHHKVDEKLKIGLNWHILDNPETGNRVIWHNGGTAGSRSMLAFLENKDLGIVMLFNDSMAKNPKMDPTNLAFLILKEINEL